MMKAEGVVIIVVIGIVIVMAVGWWFWGENVQLVTGGSFSPTTVTTINPNSVSLALGDILLFKTPAGELGAIRFDAMTDDWGADYTAWFARAGSTGPPVESHGHVYEKYWQTRGRDGHHVKDIGGDRQVECGPLRVEWSASTWLYIPDGYAFAVTSKTVPDFDSPDVKWHISRGSSP